MMNLRRRDARWSAALVVVAVLGVALVLVLTGLAWVLLVIAALVPAISALFLRPQRGVLLLVALAPFDGLLLVLGLPRIVDAWKEILVVLTLSATFVCPVNARAAARRALPGWVPGLVALFALAVVSAVIVGGEQALYGMKIGFFYLLVAITLWRCPLGRRDRDRLVTILMVTGFITAIIGLGQQVVGDARLAELGFPYNDTIRFAGDHLRSFSTFVQPFPFALFLMVVLLVGLAHSLDEPRRVRNQLFLLASPLYVAAMTFTFVRAAWLGLAIGLVYLGVRRHVLLAGIPIAIVVFLLFGGSSLSGTLLSSTSFGARTRGWDANITQVVQHPFGVGLGASGAVAETVQELDKVALPGQDAPYQPDSYYFKMLYELGVLGLWLTLLVLIGVLVTCHRAGRRMFGRDRSLTDGVTAMVLAAIAASSVATYFEIFPMDLLFWALVAVVATLDATPLEERAVPVLAQQR
jgi:hypothetical protein